MLVSLRTRPSADSDHPADLLLACHGRIRGFMATARAIATRDDAEDDAVRASARAVLRYFRVALPLHSADEDDTIAPRMKGRGVTVDAALATVASDHRTMESSLATMCALLDAIERDPSSRAANRDALAAIVGELDAFWERHLGLEEAVLVPALRELAGTEIDSIRTEMRSRRSSDPSMFASPT